MIKKAIRHVQCLIKQLNMVPCLLLLYGFVAEYKNAIDVMTQFERQMVEVTRVMDPLYNAQSMLIENAKKNGY